MAGQLKSVNFDEWFESFDYTRITYKHFSKVIMNLNELTYESNIHILMSTFYAYSLQPVLINQCCVVSMNESE